MRSCGGMRNYILPSIYAVPLELRWAQCLGVVRLVRDLDNLRCGYPSNGAARGSVVSTAGNHSDPGLVPSGYPKCLNCGKPMKPQYDEVTKRITGYLWSCGCMPEGMVLSIG